MEKKEIVTAKSYTLRNEDGSWLGQIVLTSDGMFSGVTDYGNAGFAWRSTGEKDFRDFLISLNVEYFGGKLYQGIAYMIYGKKYEQACRRFAEKILPPLQKVLKAEMQLETHDQPH
jgi:hypothetical protein